MGPKLPYIGLREMTESFIVHEGIIIVPWSNGIREVKWMLSVG